MKKKNSKLIKGINWALAGLISFLGFSSCGIANDDIPNIPDIPVAYGTPHAEFVVTGKVTDSAGQALPGIRVVVPKADYHQRAYPISSNEIRDTSYTQPNGTFAYHYYNSGMATNDSINIYMKFEDSAEEIRYEADSVKVTFLSSDLQGASGWSQGKAEKEINIELRNKESE